MGQWTNKQRCVKFISVPLRWLNKKMCVLEILKGYKCKCVKYKIGRESKQEKA